MRDATLLADFWTGFHVVRRTAISPTECVLQLEADPFVAPRCGRCRMPCALTHERRVRRVRDRDLLDQRVWLEVALRRVECLQCGVSTEHLDWLPSRSRLTLRLIAHVQTLVRLLPIKHVGELTGLHWHTIKALDRKRLAQEVRAPDLHRVRRLIMDEFALFKGHRYATVAICADTQQVLWIGEGRSRQAVRPFFEWLGEDVCKRIEAVAMDMNTAMDLEAQAHCPNARIVYDLFHVVAKFGREVIDRVRVDQANQLKADRSGRRVIKRSRWLLLRNRDNLSENQAVTLDELLAANAPLATTYVLKNQLKELWYAPDEAAANRRWQEWYDMAIESGIKPLIAFAKRLRPYLHGIISSATYRLSTSVLEGMNNRIKVIKRMAYGYRDSDHFFLKIKAAFPGKAR